MEYQASILLDMCSLRGTIPNCLAFLPDPYSYVRQLFRLPFPSNSPDSPNYIYSEHFRAFNQLKLHNLGRQKRQGDETVMPLIFTTPMARITCTPIRCPLPLPPRASPQLRSIRLNPLPLKSRGEPACIPVPKPSRNQNHSSTRAAEP